MTLFDRDAFIDVTDEMLKEEKNMKKKCKFNIGDKVINKRGTAYYHTKIGFIGEVIDICNKDGMIVKGKSMADLVPEYRKNGEWLVDPHDFDLYNPHEGKILIMVDEKNNNKIVARNLLTGKMAEAKCSPKDEWDFNKGAKLAFERLTEPEKTKGWTGKVVCVCNNIDNKFRNNDFIVGKVYAVKDGIIIGEQYRLCNGLMLITSPEQLSWTVKSSLFDCPYNCKFVEYKGGAEE